MGSENKQQLDAAQEQAEEFDFIRELTKVEAKRGRTFEDWLAGDRLHRSCYTSFGI